MRALLHGCIASARLMPAHGPVDQSGGLSGVNAAGDPVKTLQYLYPRLAAVARSLVNAADAEDLVQDTLVQVLANNPAFGGIDYPLAYTKRVMIRRAGRIRRPAKDIPVGLQQELEAPEEGDFTEMIGDSLGSY